MAVDGSAVKRRRLLRKTSSAEVVLPTGMVSFSAHAPRVGDAQMSGVAARGLSAHGRGVYKAFFASFEYWVRKRVTAGRWPGTWPSAGFNSFRAASREQRACVLAQWAAESSSRLHVKAWAFAHWTGAVPVQDVEEGDAEWRRGPSALLTWQGDWGMLRGDACGV